MFESLYMFLYWVKGGGLVLAIARLFQSCSRLVKAFIWHLDAMDSRFALCCKLPEETLRTSMVCFGSGKRWWAKKLPTVGIVCPQHCTDTWLFIQENIAKKG